MVYIYKSTKTTKTTKNTEILDMTTGKVKGIIANLVQNASQSARLAKLNA